MCKLWNSDEIFSQTLCALDFDCHFFFMAAMPASAQTLMSKSSRQWFCMKMLIYPNFSSFIETQSVRFTCCLRFETFHLEYLRTISNSIRSLASIGTPLYMLPTRLTWHVRAEPKSQYLRKKKRRKTPIAYIRFVFSSFQTAAPSVVCVSSYPIRLRHLPYATFDVEELAANIRIIEFWLFFPLFYVSGGFTFFFNARLNRHNSIPEL